MPGPRNPHTPANAAQRKAAPGTAFPGVIQRDVGFEFEVDEVDTHWKVPLPVAILTLGFYRGYKPLAKKDPLLVGTGFKVEADEREDHTSDMEIVTDAFPETAEGGRRLDAAMRRITLLCDALKRLNRQGHRVVASNELNEFGAPVANRYLTKKNQADLDFQQLRAKPQVTAGIRLRYLDRVFSDMERRSVAGMGAAPRPEARKVVGGGYDPFGGMAGIPAINHIRTAVNAAINAKDADYQLYEAGNLGSGQLRGLMAMLVSYLVEGKKGVQGYAKTIANPIMARTDFAGLYQQLPLEERRYFRRTRAQNTWVNLVLDAAEQAYNLIVPPVGMAPPANVGANQPVYEGRLFNSYAMYGATNDPRYQTDVLPELTPRRWLEGIAFGRIDFLTAAAYPNRNKSAELESLGGYGAKLDKSAGSAVGNAGIFEFRGLEERPYWEWYSFAMSFFRYIRALNRGLNDDYDQTVTPQISADLAGVGISTMERDLARGRQRVRAVGAINRW
jgi:hypothetical protein